MRFLSFVFAFLAVLGGVQCTEQISPVTIHDETIDIRVGKIEGVQQKYIYNEQTGAYFHAEFFAATEQQTSKTKHENVMAQATISNHVGHISLHIENLWADPTYHPTSFLIEEGYPESGLPVGSANYVPAYTPDPNAAGWYGSNDPAVLGTPLVTGGGVTVSLKELLLDLHTQAWPVDGNGFGYRYIQVTSNTELQFAITLKNLVNPKKNPPNPPCTTPGGCGDPQFIGLQGQNFQFHGMADEVFSLVSAPELQINSLFKFISNGNCDYNDTLCWTHPGTYLGQVGIQYGADKILLQSGAHADGMKVYINDKEITPSKHIHQFGINSNASALAQFRTTSKFTFNSDKFFINFINSDYFFNFDFGLKDSQILQAGAKQMRVTGEVCERESLMNKALLSESQSKIKAKLAATYPSYPLHGLVGQTWRNAEYCGRYFEGTVDDYVVGSLFGNEHTFNHFQH